MSIYEGHATLRYGKATVSGDVMRYETKTRRVEATGSVRIEKGDSMTTSEKVIYWLDTGKFETEGPSKTVVKEPKTPAQ